MVISSLLTTVQPELTFWQKRTRELAGLGLIAFSLFLLVSLLSFTPGDPSLNFATDTEPGNWGGLAGAYFAGTSIDFLGLGNIALILAPLCWGVVNLWKMRLKLWLRLSFLLFALPFAAGSAAVLDHVLTLPEDWPARSFGGYIGSFLYRSLAPLVTAEGFAAMMGFSALALVFFACGLPLKGWITLGRGTSKGIGRGVAIAANAKTILKTRSLESFVKIPPQMEKSPSAPKPVVEVTRRKSKAAEPPKQTSLELKIPDEFQLPPLTLLRVTPPRSKQEVISDSALSQNAALLEKVLDDFGITGKITKVHPGPVVTLYELEPAPGVKSSRIIGLADDITRSMSAVSARIAVIPGQNAIGIELPNAHRQTVYFRELLETAAYEDSSLSLPLVLGKDIGGEPVIADLAKMPHLLVAGTTGSGKSVAINTMILSLLYRFTPDQCRFIMIDPKMLELSSYEGIPHLLSPVVTEPSKAIVALKWTVKEMENRYRLMSTMGVRNIAGYNQRIKEAERKGEPLFRTVQTGFEPDTGKPIMEKVPLEMTILPFIVVVVDEMADLMLVAGKDIEGSIQRLAQMARAAGIHIIMATQRPSVDVITGVIKANFPTRISFQVTSRIDSRTILGEQGAEQLLGQGDMLYMAGGGRILRAHGPFVDDHEASQVVEFLKAQGSPLYVEDVTKDDEEESLFMGESGGEADALYDQAVAIVSRDRKASTSYVQRALKIGYNRAANIIERMEKEGVVSRPNHAGKREVLAPENG